MGKREGWRKIVRKKYSSTGNTREAVVVKREPRGRKGEAM